VKGGIFFFKSKEENNMERELGHFGLADFFAEKRRRQPSFAGISLVEDVPDQTTICRFRNLLAKKKLLQPLLNEVNRQACRPGEILCYICENTQMSFHLEFGQYTSRRAIKFSLMQALPGNKLLSSSLLHAGINYLTDKNTATD